MNDDFFQNLENKSKEKEKEDKLRKEERDVRRVNKSNENYLRNTISYILKIFGWIIGIGGVISGLAIIGDSEVSGITFILVGLLSMFLILGIAEIIQLLDDIKQKMDMFRK